MISFKQVINFLFILFFFIVINLSATATENEARPLEKNKIIYIQPGQWGQLFAMESSCYNRDDCLEPIYQLRKVAADQGYYVKQSDSLDALKDFEYIFIFEIPFNQLHYLPQYPKEKLILFLWEPPSVCPENYNPKYHEFFGKIYTWNDDLVDNVKYFKLYYPAMHPMIDEVVDFESKKLCTLISCNKHSNHPNELYTERLKVITFFEALKCKEFDLYGKGWPNTFKTYKGSLNRKVDIQKFYKFCFSYENIKHVSGYVTEKIFDCFRAGCVPIYWGASNITTYVPKNCFIAREDFESNQAVYEFIQRMSKDEYLEYIKNIQAFLSSEAAQKFSTQHFVETFMELIKTPSSKK